MKRSIILLIMLFPLLCGCNYFEDGQNEISLTYDLDKKLIGEWEGCEYHRGDRYTITNELIIMKYKYYDNIYSASYIFISNDSIQVTFNCLEDNISQRTTKCKVIFETNDKVLLTNFLPVDVGVIGFDNVKLERDKR